MNFLDVDSEDLQIHGNVIDQIFEEKIDGIIIRNFLQDEEVKLLLDNYLTIPLSEQFCTGEGIHTFPESFSSLNDEAKSQEELIKNGRFWSSFESKFGIDYIAKIKTLFLSLSSFDLVDVPLDKANPSKLYNPSTFR